MWSKAKHTQDPQATQSEGKARDQVEHMPGGQSRGIGKVKYPGPRVLIPIVVSVCLVIFLTALDRTIVGVAIPAISNQFDSFDDISWYEAAYLLTSSTLQLPMGKFYTFFPAKWVFIATVAVFELGSIVCAAAPTSNAFIVGRAIAGMGSAGTLTGATVIFADFIPLKNRPKYQGFFGAAFGLASIAGPLIGGVFTTEVNWRWCFWINLPIGGIAMGVLLFLLPAKSPPKKHAGESFLQRARQFDPLGTAFLLPGLVLFLLGLQWGGNQYSWGSARVVSTLVLGLLLLGAFAFSQKWSGENGTIPPRIIHQRSIAAGAVATFGFGSALIILTFYLPIWFQAIKQLSAFDAGIRLLPYFLGSVFFVIGSGFLVSKIGYYTPLLMIGSAIMIIGCGLLTTFRMGTTTGEWVGFELINGAGIGLSLAQANNAVQTVLSREDIPIGITIVSFTQFLGGTISISICQTVLSNTLAGQLSNEIPGFDASQLSQTGTTSLSSLVPADQLPKLLAAYDKAIDNVFYCAMAFAFVAFIASFFLEWKTVRKPDEVAKEEDA